MSNNNGTTQDSALSADGRHPADLDVMTFVTLDTLRTLIHDAGFRAETVVDGSVTLLRSASNGLGFDIRSGNVFSEKPDHLADVAFVAVFAVQGGFPLDLLNLWNRTHRFGRLFIDRTVPEREFLVLSLDVSVLGGVTAAYLRHKLLIWDSLVQQLVPWLREQLGKIASTVDTKETTPSTDWSRSVEPAKAD